VLIEVARDGRPELWRCEFHPETKMPTRLILVDIAPRSSVVNGFEQHEYELSQLADYMLEHRRIFFYDTINIHSSRRYVKTTVHENTPKQGDEYFGFAGVTGLKQEFDIRARDGRRFFVKDGFWQMLWNNAPLMNCIDLFTDVLNPDEPINYVGLIGPQRPANSATDAAPTPPVYPYLGVIFCGVELFFIFGMPFIPVLGTAGTKGVVALRKLLHIKAGMKWAERASQLTFKAAAQNIGRELIEELSEELAESLLAGLTRGVPLPGAVGGIKKAFSSALDGVNSTLRRSRRFWASLEQLTPDIAAKLKALGHAKAFLSNTEELKRLQTSFKPSGDGFAVDLHHPPALAPRDGQLVMAELDDAREAGDVILVKNGKGEYVPVKSITSMDGALPRALHYDPLTGVTYGRQMQLMPAVGSDAASTAKAGIGRYMTLDGVMVSAKSELPWGEVSEIADGDEVKLMIRSNEDTYVIEIDGNRPTSRLAIEPEELAYDLCLTEMLGSGVRVKRSPSKKNAANRAG